MKSQGQLFSQQLLNKATTRYLQRYLGFEKGILWNSARYEETRRVCSWAAENATPPADVSSVLYMIRDATWQNQLSDCVPSEDSDQPGSNRKQDHWSELRYNLHCDNSELTLGLKTHECSSPNRLLQLAVEPLSTTRNVFVLSVDLNRPRAECLHDRKIHFKVYRCTIEISVGYRIFWARPIAKTWG